MKRLGMVFLLSGLVVGCQDRRTATGPDATALPGELNALIVDGAHSGGNPDFFFLPPLQPSPLRSRNFDRGRFNPNLLPVVKICIGRNITPAGECAVPLTKNSRPVVFNAVRGWDGLPDWVDPEQYHVLWRTRDYNLVADGRHAYRILVKVASRLLGFLDVVPTNQLLGALRITAGGQDVGWLDDWVVPIRFRIEQGALCADHTNQAGCTASTVVGAAPGSAGDTTVAVVLPSGHAGVSVPAGAIKTGDVVTIVVEKQAPPYGTGTAAECLPTDFGLEQSKGCYHFRTEPANYPFLTNVRIEVCVDPLDLPPEALRVWKYDSDGESGPEELQRAEPTLIDCTGFVALNADGSNAPASFATTVWRGAGRLFANLVGPRELFAATMAGTPKGLGGLAGSFSDFGGAVTQEEGLLPDLYFGAEDVPDITHSTSSNLTVEVNVQNIGGGSAQDFKVSLQLWTDHYESLDSLTSFLSGDLSLGAGGNMIVTFTIPCSLLNTSWSYFLKAEADPYDLLEESVDGNNSSLWSPPFHSVGSSGSGYCGSGSF
jgi:hypothetical protein